MKMGEIKELRNKIQALLAIILRPLYVNALYIWLNNIILALTGFLFWIFAARGFSTEHMGLATAIVSALILINRLCYLGLGISIVRFLPESKDGGIKLINFSVLVAGASALVASIIFLAGIHIWSPALQFLRAEPLCIVLFVAFAVALSVSAIQDQTLVGLRKPKYMLIKNGVLGAVRITLIRILISLQQPFTIVSAHLAPVFLGVALMTGWFLRRAMPSYRLSLPRKFSLPPGFRSFTFTNHTLFLLLYAPASLFPIILLNTVGTDASAYFFVAWSTTVPLMSVGLALAMSLLSEGSANTVSLHSNLKRALIGGGVVVGIGVAVFTALPELPLSLFGKAYVMEAVQPLRILAIATVFSLFTNIYIAVAQIKKQLRELLIIAAIIFSISCVSGYFLSLRMGALGPAIGWLLSQIVSAAYSGIRLYKDRLISLKKLNGYQRENRAS